MKKVILAPDSFKGTMSSIEVCNIMGTAIRKHCSDMEIVKIPIADGGEGMVDCFLEALGGRKVPLKVKGPYFDDIDSFYGVLSDGRTAVVEMAAAAGLPLVEDRKDPSRTTTFGVGQLIAHAMESRCSSIIIGIGGSCTNDGGAGMAAALGIRFLDEAGIEFIPTGATLSRIARIDGSGRLKGLTDCSILAACDVDNPLCGANGAAYVFGPQKGADERMVKILDENLMHLAERIRKDLGLDVADIPGTGAAGGLGAGIMAFAGGTLRRGMDIVLDAVGFDEMMKGTDLVITGEGKMDGQSLRGKVIAGVAQRVRPHEVPVIAVVGDIGEDIEGMYAMGVTAVMSTNRVAVPFERAKLRCRSDLALTMDTLMRLMVMHQMAR